MTVTKQELDARATRLGELTGTPIHVGTWSPGDGWTRYQLLDDQHQPAFRSERYYRKGELYEALGLALSVAYALKEQAV